MSYVGTTDFLLEVSKGNIPGHSLLNYQASNLGVGVIGTEQSFWNLGTIYQYLSADTQLFASSTNASDTSVTLAVLGLDGSFVEKIRTVTLNGQNQVALSGLLLRDRRMVVTGSTAPLGDVYLAESDTLTAGVPDTASKIQMKMNQGANIANNSTITVPADKTFFIATIITRSGKAVDARIKLRLRVEGGVFTESIDFDTFEQQNQIEAGLGAIPEKADVDSLITPRITNLRSVLAVTFIVVENSELSTASMSQMNG